MTTQIQATTNLEKPSTLKRAFVTLFPSSVYGYEIGKALSEGRTLKEGHNDAVETFNEINKINKEQLKDLRKDVREFIYKQDENVEENINKTNEKIKNLGIWKYLLYPTIGAHEAMGEIKKNK